MSRKREMFELGCDVDTATLHTNSFFRL